ncbi:hypothetical protein ACFRAE_11510 [Sphingobacterium sp. HJSM2_6]|uniref:hypothetical protein n=1 Tax=Sphingobacterium sp. HJSM2_6 TaxID=3366264 RepID=UPI003BDEEA29
MDAKVKSALDASLNAYAANENIDAALIQQSLYRIFDADDTFMGKVAQLDGLFDDHQRFEELREHYFDLLMINFFAEDVQKLEEDYLDSEEWEAIEEETIDRGSELLNVLLYLRECSDDEVEPSLDDFLKEFLLVEEDEFQDEYEIYEVVIANQLLMESNYAQIAQVANGLTEKDELQELFYPLMSFFLEPQPKQDQLTEYSNSAANKSLSLALYQLIVHFNN